MKLSLSRHEGCSKKNAPWLDRRTLARLRSAAGAVEPAGARVEVILVDDEFIQELNRVYRGVNMPTDVLSFSYREDAGGTSPEKGTVGEVYISCDTVEARARRRAVAPEHLLLRVGVHGLLHVAGYVHGTAVEAQRMEAEERRILSRYLAPSEVEELL